MYKLRILLSVSLGITFFSLLTCGTLEKRESSTPNKKEDEVDKNTSSTAPVAATSNGNNDSTPILSEPKIQENLSNTNDNLNANQNINENDPESVESLNNVNSNSNLSTDDEIVVTGVSLNKSTTTINQGGTEQLSASLTPQDATNKELSWSSDNEGVATISASGLVSAVAAGTATITVTSVDGSYTATCTITVNGEITIYAVDRNGGAKLSGNLGGRAGVDDLCVSEKPAGVTGINIHAMVAIDADDEIVDMPANYNLPADVEIKSVDGTLLANSFNKLINYDFNDTTTRWQIPEDDIFNGDLMQKLGATATYAFVGVGDTNMAGSVGGNCSGLTSDADEGYGAIDLSSGNLVSESGTNSCDVSSMMYMDLTILCLSW